MATSAITGTIKDAIGQAVENVVCLIRPEPAAVNAAQASAGVGLLAEPVEVLTDDTGVFSMDLTEGFRYRLTIDAIGFDRVFVCPTDDTEFHLLGLEPTIEGAATAVAEDGDTSALIKIKVDHERTVRERFTTLVLEASDTLGGVYASIKEWDLIAGITFYDYTEEDLSSSTRFYRARYKKATDLSPYSDIVAAEYSKPEELHLSPEELKTLYLFGADLTDDDGNPFPRRIYEHYLAAATDWLAKKLDIDLSPTEHVSEVQDHYARDYGRWGYFQLDRYPVIKLRKVLFKYPSMTDGVEISLDWTVLTEGGASGVVQIVPGQGNIADVLLIPGSLMPIWSGRTGRVPGVWRFDYRSGFEIGALPADLKHAIGMMASIGVLNIAGDLVAGAGIATKSVSLPGLSQSIGTTSSATNSGYGARIIEYQKELKDLIPNLQRYYGKGTRLVVV